MVALPQDSTLFLIIAVVIERLYVAGTVMMGLFRLFKTCRKDIDFRMSTKALHPDTANYMKKYDENFAKIEGNKDLLNLLP